MPIIGVIDSSKSGNLSASSWEQIATATGTGSSQTLSFATIPQTYKDLMVMFTGASTTTNADQGTQITINSGTTGALSTYMYGNYASAGGASPNVGTGTSSYYLNTFGNNNQTQATVLFMDYSSTTKTKTVHCYNGMQTSSIGYTFMYSGVFNTTTAISQISLIASVGNWNTNTRCTLYGVKA
jgi:hypothetical protein